MYSCNCLAREQKKVGGGSISTTKKKGKGSNFKVYTFSKASYIQWDKLFSEIL